MSAKVEQRTTRDGAPLVGRRTIRADAIRPLLEGVQKLEAGLGRAVRRAEDARRAEAEKRLTALVDGAVQNIYAKIAQADKRKEEQEFELRVFGELFPPTTKDFLFGPEESK